MKKIKILISTLALSLVFNNIAYSMEGSEKSSNDDDSEIYYIEKNENSKEENLNEYDEKQAMKIFNDIAKAQEKQQKELLKSVIEKSEKSRKETAENILKDVLKTFKTYVLDRLKITIKKLPPHLQDYERNVLGKNLSDEEYSLEALSNTPYQNISDDDFDKSLNEKRKIVMNILEDKDTIETFKNILINKIIETLKINEFNNNDKEYLNDLISIMKKILEDTKKSINYYLDPCFLNKRLLSNANTIYDSSRKDLNTTILNLIENYLSKFYFKKLEEKNENNDDIKSTQKNLTKEHNKILKQGIDTIEYDEEEFEKINSKEENEEYLKDLIENIIEMNYLMLKYKYKDVLEKIEKIDQKEKEVSEIKEENTPIEENISILQEMLKQESENQTIKNEINTFQNTAENLYHIKENKEKFEKEKMERIQFKEKYRYLIKLLEFFDKIRNPENKKEKEEILKKIYENYIIKKRENKNMTYEDINNFREINRIFLKILIENTNKTKKLNFPDAINLLEDHSETSNKYDIIETKKMKEIYNTLNNYDSYVKNLIYFVSSLNKMNKAEIQCLFKKLNSAFDKDNKTNLEKILLDNLDKKGLPKKEINFFISKKEFLRAIEILKKEFVTKIKEIYKSFLSKRLTYDNKSYVDKIMKELINNDIEFIPHQFNFSKMRDLVTKIIYNNE